MLQVQVLIALVQLCMLAWHWPWRPWRPSPSAPPARRHSSGDAIQLPASSIGFAQPIALAPVRRHQPPVAAGPNLNATACSVAGLIMAAGESPELALGHLLHRLLPHWILYFFYFLKHIHHALWRLVGLNARKHSTVMPQRAHPIMVTVSLFARC